MLYLVRDEKYQVFHSVDAHRTDSRGDGAQCTADRTRRTGLSLQLPIVRWTSVRGVLLWTRSSIASGRGRHILADFGDGELSGESQLSASKSGSQTDAEEPCALNQRGCARAV